MTNDRLVTFRARAPTRVSRASRASVARASRAVFRVTFTGRSSLARVRDHLRRRVESRVPSRKVRRHYYVRRPRQRRNGQRHVRRRPGVSARREHPARRVAPGSEKGEDFAPARPSPRTFGPYAHLRLHAELFQRWVTTRRADEGPWRRRATKSSSRPGPAARARILVLSEALARSRALADFPRVPPRTDRTTLCEAPRRETTSSTPSRAAIDALCETR